MSFDARYWSRVIHFAQVIIAVIVTAFVGRHYYLGNVGRIVLVIAIYKALDLAVYGFLSLLLRLPTKSDE
jgi:hypothetical protein